MAYGTHYCSHVFGALGLKAGPSGVRAVRTPCWPATDQIDGTTRGKPRNLCQSKIPADRPCTSQI